MCTAAMIPLTVLANFNIKSMKLFKTEMMLSFKVNINDRMH